MPCSRELAYHFIDGVLLVIVFLFQSVVINYFLISHFRSSSLQYLWFLLDFICLFVFSITLFIAYQKHSKLRRREKHTSVSYSASFSSTTARTNSRAGNRSNHSGDSSTGPCPWVPNISQVPMGYVTWVFYSTILVMKLVILFKSDIPQKLNKDDFFGPQLLKIAVGLSAFILTLLVEAHHNSQRDQVRAAFIKFVSFGMALEVLDTVSFLTLLIGSESHLVYTYKFENMIIILSSINLMLPAVTFYKLTASNFGRTYPIPLETIYKISHLILVDSTYFGVRIYLWKMFSMDTSLFFVKNVYAILTFLRDIYPDIKNIQLYYKRRRARIVTVNAKAANGSDQAQALQGNGHARSNGNGRSVRMDTIDEESSGALATFQTAPTPPAEDEGTSHL